MSRSSKSVESYMPLWIADYLADTQHLTRDEHGAYLLLLMAYWRKGEPLADDDRKLAAIANASPAEWRKLRPVLAEFFQVADGVWTQKRVEAELTRAKAIRAKRAEAGAKGAGGRWQSDSKPMANAMANASQNDAISPSPSPRKEGSVPDGTGAAAPVAPPIAEQIWKAGVPFLVSHGVSDKPARSLLGKWRKEHGDAATLSALIAAQTQGVSEPVAWIEGSFRNGGKPSKSGRSVAERQWDARRRGAALSAGYRCGDDGVWYAPDGSVVGDPAGEGASPGH